MRPGLDATTLSLLSSGAYDDHWLFQVANGSGTLVDVSARASGYALTLPSPNSPISSLSLTLIREINRVSDSLAPFMGASTLNRLNDGTTYSPLLEIGRVVVASVALTARGDARPSSGFYEVFRGRISSDAWPGQFGSVVVAATDQGGRMQKEKMETDRVYTAGTSIEAVAQAVLNDRYGAGTYTLSVPVATGQVLSADYRAGKQKTVWEVLTGLAQSIGFVVWWRYGADNVARLTLFEPNRAKTASDFTFPLIRDVSQLDVQEDEIANVLFGEFSDEGGARVSVGPTEDTVSIAKYGGVRRAAWIAEEADSPVKSAADMQTILDAALSDMSDPDAIQVVDVPPFPFGEVAVDLYRFAADSIHYDSPQDLAPFSITVEGNAGALSTSRISVRGRPSAGYRTWAGRRKEVVDSPPESYYGLNDFTWHDEATGRRYTWTRGPGVVDVWGNAPLTFSDPLPAGAWDQARDAAEPLGAIDSLLIPWPKEGTRTIARIYGLGFDSSGNGQSGTVYDIDVPGTAAPFDFSVSRTLNANGTQETIAVTLDDVRGVGAGVDVYAKRLGVERGPFTAALSAGAYRYTYTLDPDHLLYIRVVARRTDGGSPRERVYEADIDTVPGIPDVQPVRVVNTETLLVDGADTDTATLWRQTDDGAGNLGVEAQIPARGSDPRYGAFDVTAGTTTQRFRIYGKNSAGVAGPYRDVRVEPYVQGAPALDVRAEARTTDYLIHWAGDDVTLSINGAAYAAPPATPINVNRPAAGSAALEYTFRATRGGVPVTNTVSVVALDADTVTPDLDVDPTAADNSTASFTATASNPRTGATLPVVVTLTGCTATVGGAAFTSGSTLASGATIVVARPAFGVAAGTVEFRASVTGGGFEAIQRTVPSVQRDTVTAGIKMDVDASNLVTITYTPTDATVAATLNGAAVTLSGTTPGTRTYQMVRSEANDQKLVVTATRTGINPASAAYTIDRDDEPGISGVSVEDRKAQPVIRAIMDDDAAELRLYAPGAALVATQLRANGVQLTYTAPAIAVNATREYHITAAKSGGTEREVWRGVVTGPSPDTVTAAIKLEAGPEAGGVTPLTVTYTPTDATVTATVNGAAVTLAGTTPGVRTYDMARSEATDQKFVVVVSKTGTQSQSAAYTIDRDDEPDLSSVSVEDRRSQVRINAHVDDDATELRWFAQNADLTWTQVDKEGAPSLTTYPTTATKTVTLVNSLAVDAERRFRIEVRKGTGTWRIRWEQTVKGPSPVSAVREQPSETATTGTLTLEPLTGATFDQVRFSTRSGNGAWSAWAADAAPYSASVSLVEKHVSAIAYEVSSGGVIIQENVVSYDVGTLPNVLDAVAAYANGTASVTAVFDADTAVGLGKGEWRVDGGAATAFEVAAGRRGSFSLAQTTAVQSVEIRGLDAAGAPGPWFPLPISKAGVDAAPRVVSATSYRSQAGNCATSTPLVHRIDFTVDDTSRTGYVARLRISENGAAFTTVAADYGLNAGFMLDEFTGQYHGAGATLDVAYEVIIVRSSGSAVVDGKSAGTVSSNPVACA